ncbi:hypothetical protein BDZ94DRAFT_1309542 [Collybia nuda]|uniref:chitin deacetylase n=1 Tax=Collybia nuda TaxID=64659 RepID=A0A9P5Y7M1_9AGAR|nr:hypothetical protein BDZ94DRAFT_1309542 [Collybia nuda]
MFPAFLLFFSLPFASAVPATRDHVHNINHPLPATSWYLPRDHPANDLFKRAPGDGVNYAPVGSPTWSSGFPQSTPDPNKLPAEWVNALNAAVAAGKIPNVPQSTNTPGVNPVYPQGVNPNGPEVCSATYKCRHPEDIWDAPPNYFGTGFDDGPLPDTPKLLQFLQQNHETATHFMIGVNILAYPQQFSATFESGGDIAAHTWTHPYMTTLNNLEVLGQLGWTSALIKNSTGGRIPRFWRPPYGDSDNRVRAIAKEIFGLETILWNQDTRDWSLLTGGTTQATIHNSMQQWLSGPKTPGLIVLEHESSDQSVQAFMDAYPLIKSNGWNAMSVAQLAGNGTTYRNAKDSMSSVTPAGILVDDDIVPSGTPSSSSSSSSLVPSSAPPSRSTVMQTLGQSQTPTGSGNSLAATNTPTESAALCNTDTTWSRTLLLACLTVTVLSAWP